jgi:glycosyltransferase involved in cell wall biosynthesis
MDVYPNIAVALDVLGSESLLTRFLGASLDWSRRRADGVIALGDEMKACLLARGVPADKIHVAENWAGGLAVQPLPFPEGALTIHYSGNLGRAHETGTILTVIERLRNRPEFQFIFAGGGSRRPRIETFCRERALANVEFRPYCTRAQLSQSLGEGHLGLVTQLPQSLGSVVPSKIYGVMAAGRPLLYIGPDKSTAADHIRRFSCGWHIRPGDAATLVELLHHLNGNRRLIAQAGARARFAFERNFDQAIGVRRVLDILGAGTAADAPVTGCVLSALPD